MMDYSALKCADRMHIIRSVHFRNTTKVLALMAGILKKIKRTACSRGPFLYSKQNHGQNSTTAELIRRLAEQVFGNKEKADTWLTQRKPHSLVVHQWDTNS
jgi:hypothetical protein